MLWTEPAGQDASGNHTIVTPQEDLKPNDYFGGREYRHPVYSKIRRFIVVKAGDLKCNCMYVARILKSDPFVFLN